MSRRAPGRYVARWDQPRVERPRSCGSVPIFGSLAGRTASMSRQRADESQRPVKAEERTFGLVLQWAMDLVVSQFDVP